MTRLDLWLRSHARPGTVQAFAACLLGAPILLSGCGGGGSAEQGAPDALVAGQPPIAANGDLNSSANGNGQGKCNLSALQNALSDRGVPIEGNVSLASVAMSTGGSFTPPNATAPIENVPDFCRVAGVARPTADSHINFEVWLPLEDWNSKYLSVTEGGLAGQIGYTSLADAMRRGYATASTDTGHMVADTWWMVAHPEKVIDYGHRAKHLQTVAAKAIIEAYYGDAPERSYFAGCSNGGRQGLMELQRYPDDYDAFVVGAPANNWTGQTTNWVMKRKALHEDPASTIPDDKLPIIQAAALAQCDALDGVTDSVISDPRQCNFNPDVLACPEGKEDNTACLTQPQIAALKQIYRGPIDSAGNQLFPGDEPGTEALPNSWSNYITGNSPVRLGVVTVSGMLYNRSDWDFRTFNFDVDHYLLEAQLGGILNATDPDLREQKAKGVKIIAYHGWGDPALQPRETVKYYERVIEQIGGVAETQDFFRLFMVPGMIHCRGGLGPNLFGQSPPFIPDSTPETDIIKALERWVEQGVAPDRLIATKYANDAVTEPVLSQRPLCPYPQVQKYDGGDPNVPTSFSCVSPESSAP